MVKYSYADIEKKIDEAKAGTPPTDKFDTLYQKCTTYFQAGLHDKAVEVCVQMVAIVPEDDKIMLCSVQHNLASALQSLGCYDAAKPLYASAFNLLETEPAGCCACYSETKPTQLAFMKAKAELNEKKEKSKPFEYLDADGLAKTWTTEEIEAAVALAKEWGVESPPGNIVTGTVKATGDAFNSIGEGIKRLSATVTGGNKPAGEMI